MKLIGNRIESFLKIPNTTVRIILVYGSDVGLIKERIECLIKWFCNDTKDPFQIVNLSSNSVKNDPSLFFNEATSLSMTGKKRIVLLHNVIDNITNIIQLFLKNPIGNSLILLESVELESRSKLRKLIECDANAVSIPCYIDRDSKLETIIKEKLQENGLIAASDVISWISNHLDGDRLAITSAIKKLALYIGCNNNVSIKDVVDCIGDTITMSLDDLVICCANGNHLNTQCILDRLYRNGTSPITILISLHRYFQRLHILKSFIIEGKSIKQALELISPSLHFHIVDHIRIQLIRWSIKNISIVLDILLTTEISCKNTSMLAEEICCRAIIQVTKLANKADTN
ncbi:MAG: DNA polymerase III subunit delta [Rhodospirillaceae bacterium]|jgi:DNA polymerase-3 subunit delta|nr:DNA polymerase III subunit delta [Rhodospirillaceae bacterium]